MPLNIFKMIQHLYQEITSKCIKHVQRHINHIKVSENFILKP